MLRHCTARANANANATFQFVSNAETANTHNLTLPQNCPQMPLVALSPGYPAIRSVSTKFQMASRTRTRPPSHWPHLAPKWLGLLFFSSLCPFVFRRIGSGAGPEEVGQNRDGCSRMDAICYSIYTLTI